MICAEDSLPGVIGCERIDMHLTTFSVAWHLSGKYVGSPTYIHIYFVCMHTYMCARVNMHTYVCILTHARARAHTHTHTHTHM